MRPSPSRVSHYVFLATVGLAAICGLGGCAVVAVVDTAATVATKTAGLAADAAIGTVKIAGKAVGKAADAVTGSDRGPSK